MPSKTDAFRCAGLAIMLLMAGQAGANGQSTPSDAGDRAIIDLGDPYSIDGVQYRPVDNPTLDEVGYASFSTELDGVSIAHKTLPIGGHVELTAIASGRTILARVIERGPMSNAILVMLSCDAARQLALNGDNFAPVRVRRIRPSPPDAGALDRGEAAGARLPTPTPVLAALTKKLPPKPQPERLRGDCATNQAPSPVAPPVQAKPARKTADPARPPATETTTVAPHSQAPTSESDGFVVENGSASVAPAKAQQSAAVSASYEGYAVQIGAFASRASADAQARRLGGHVEQAGRLFRVRAGPYRTRAAAERALPTIRAKGFADARVVSIGGR